MFMRKRELLTQEGHWLPGSEESTQQLERVVLNLSVAVERIHVKHTWKNIYFMSVRPRKKCHKSNIPEPLSPVNERQLSVLTSQSQARGGDGE